jgi:Ca2+-binding RTX toxin-like protein
MRRILLLTTLAAMLAAAMALSGVAQAKPTIVTKADAKCLAEAAKTVQQPGFKPADYAFHGGDEGQNDFRFQGSADVPDVFCGFGGVDATSTLEAVDIFLGGEGDDEVGINNGTFYGQEGGDLVISNNGTFYGSEGNDTVSANESRGTFNGGAGDDFVRFNNLGTFDGGDGVDTVSAGCGPTMNVEFAPPPC